MLSTETVDNRPATYLEYLLSRYNLATIGYLRATDSLWTQSDIHAKPTSYITIKMIQATNAMHLITVQRTVLKNEMPTATQLKEWAKKVLYGKTLNVEITIQVVDILR